MSPRPNPLEVPSVLDELTAGGPPRVRPLKPAAPPPAQAPPPAAGQVPQAVLDAFTQVRRHPADWAAFSVRIPAGTRYRMLAIMLAHKEATQNPALRLGYYLNAAMAAIPDDVDRAVALADDWPAGITAPPVQTYRLHKDVITRLRRLSDQLRLLEVRVRMWEITSAAAIQFVAKLDSGTGVNG